MKLIIAGKNSIAVDILEYALENLKIPVFVILNKTENFKNGFQKSLGFYANLWNIKILGLEDVYDDNEIIFLSLEFDQIISPNKFRSKFLFNIHFSLLPAYKGVYTSAIPLLNGEKKTGVTLHEIDFGIDTGNIICQREFEISKNMTARDLYLNYIEQGTLLVKENLSNLVSGNFTSTPQPILGSSYYGKNSIQYSNLKIDYRKTAIEIVNQIRAFSFREFQLPKYDKHIISSWEIVNQKSNMKPGTIVKLIDNGIRITTIDYDVELKFDLYQSLWEYCRINDFENLKIMLNQHDLDLEVKTKEGWTALIIAAYNGANECVDMLIEANANVNAYNYNRTNVLMFAKTNMLKSNNKEIVVKLIRNGAKLESKDIFNKSVLDWVKEESDEYYKFLKSQL